MDNVPKLTFLPILRLLGGGTIYVIISVSGIGSACCNPSVWGDGIRGWLEDGSPPKEVARSLWCLHQPYGHVKPPLGDGMALGVG